MIIVGIILCALAIIIPYKLQAEVQFDPIVWTVYSADRCDCNSYGWTYPAEASHLQLSSSSNGRTNMTFSGHTLLAYFECAISDPGSRDKIENEFFNFTYADGVTDTHTIVDGGFLFNISHNGPRINNGYMISYDTSGRAALYYITGGTGGSCTDLPVRNGVSTDVLHYSAPYALEGITNGTYTGCTPIISAYSGSGVHNVAIQATADHLVYIDNDRILFDIDLPYATTGTAFGPYAQWKAHGCPSISTRTFSNVACGVNKYPPKADFDYNAPIVDIKTPVTINYDVADGNVPATDLTYYWTVEKLNDDGTATVLWKDQSTPFTGYNASGVGKYRTTLKVKNEYQFWSETVTKNVEIVMNPTINIDAVKTQYDVGDIVQFKADAWYNSNSATGDVIIENIVSKKLYSATIDLPGSSSIDGTSGTLTAVVDFEYTDDTKSSKTVSIPEKGITVTDSANSEKELSKITITYKSLPGLAEINSGSAITYSYVTKEPLANYYSGGVSPRKYEISNVATCKILLATGYTTANDNATTELIERKMSFYLSGTINNNNAITEPPICNTEFLLTGTSNGGENIARYIVVSNGKSSLIELPYGEYSLSEDSGFTLGYDSIDPISVTIDKTGITYNDANKISDKGAIPFIKPLQVTTINVTRTCKFEDGIDIISDTDFKTKLVGSPVVAEIKAEFDLTSPMSDSNYYYDGNTYDLIVPIGTYAIEEVQAYRYVALNNITVDGHCIWDRFLNATSEYKTPKSTFASAKGMATPVVLNYTADIFVYDEVVYDNNLHFDASLFNYNGSNIRNSDIERVLQNPEDYRYPITLTHSVTNESYCGIIESGYGIDFNYMNPGKYIISCHNNMYMDIDRLKEVNSEFIEFGKENDEYYLIIPADNYSSGDYSEDTYLMYWRGYSDIDSESSQFEPDVRTHVALKANAYDQMNVPVTGLNIEFFKDDEPLYFIQRDGRWYPSEKGVTDAVSVFSTDENGEINIYKFPVGEFIVKDTAPDGMYSSTHTQTFDVDGSRNIGLKMYLTDVSRWDVPASIDVVSLKNVINIDETVRLANTVSPATACKNVVFESLNGDVLSVDAEGNITGQKQGTAKIIAKGAINHNIIGEIDFSVLDPDDPDMRDLRQTISSLRLELGETYKASVTYCPSNVKSPNITWTSSASSIVSVSSDGTIAAKAIGTADITATCNGISSSCRVTVGKTEIAVQSIGFLNDSLTLIYNKNELNTGKVDVEVLPDNASNPIVTFTSSDPDVVSVDANGNLIAKKAGLVNITASSSNGIEASCIVSSVSLVEKININATTLSLKLGGSAQIKTAVTPEGSLNERDLVWESSDESVITVDENGIVTSVGEGQAVISVKTTYNGITDVKAECVVTASVEEFPPVDLDVCGNDVFTSNTFDETIEMSVDEEFEFYTRIKPASSTNTTIEWSFSRSNVISIGPADEDEFNPASVTNKWKIKAYGDQGGEVTVIGRVKGTSVQTTFKVAVDAPGTGFTLTKDTPPLLIIGKEPYDETTVGIVFDNVLSSARSITWTVSDDSIVELSYLSIFDKRNVIVTALAPGRVTLTAEVTFRKGGTYTQSIDIIVEEPRIDVLVDGESVTEITIEQGNTVKIAVEPNYLKGSADEGFEITQSNINIIAFEGLGTTTNGYRYKLTANAPGETILTITPTNSEVSPTTIKVIVPGLSIVANNVDGGVQLSLAATGVNPPDSVIWVSGDESIATVDSDGMLRPVSSGTVAVTAIAGSQTAQITLNVEVPVTDVEMP